VSKGRAIALHRERRGLAPEETAAVGDSPSDLEAAPVVGAVFIVANGAGAIRAAGGHVGNAFVTPSAGGNGVAEAVASLLGPDQG
jgi:hydroxymethylpyrimidine pyrophosphatase-like HAD family hydrolase